MMKTERGFTLVEMLIATAITGLIINVLGVVVYQIITVTECSSDSMIALHELQKAAYWFNIDGQKANAASSGNELVLTLPDDSSITYVLVGTELQRNAGESQMVLARNIEASSFSVHNRVVTMNLTSSPAGRQHVSEQAAYRVYLRLSGGGGDE